MCVVWRWSMIMWFVVMHVIAWKRQQHTVRVFFYFPWPLLTHMCTWKTWHTCFVASHTFPYASMLSEKHVTCFLTAWLCAVVSWHMSQWHSIQYVHSYCVIFHMARDFWWPSRFLFCPLSRHCARHVSHFWRHLVFFERTHVFCVFCVWQNNICL